MHRTFINLADDELAFLKNLQSVIKKKTGSRVRLADVLRGVIIDYKKMIELRADPDFLSTYRDGARRTRFSSKNKGLRDQLLAT